MTGVNPFNGGSKPSRVNIFDAGSGGPSRPVPHSRNYSYPIKILETFFGKVDKEEGAGKTYPVPGSLPVNCLIRG